jgi:predicted O-methyltransferase YrrM
MSRIASHSIAFLRSRYRGSKQPFVDWYISWRLAGGAAIRTHLTSEEKLALYRLARRERPATTVEIGSYLGASAWFLAAGLRDAGAASSRVYCIDTWENDAMSEGRMDTWAQFRTNIAGLERFIIPLRGWSTEVVKEFDGHVHLLFIDGDHSYAGVKADIDAWLPRLAPGGVVALHDIGWAEGVQRVVREDIAPRAKRSACLPNLYWAWI